MDDIEKFKPFIYDLIKFYYEDLDNGAGGLFHIVLDDGNIEHSHIWWCQEQCEKEGDTFGIFLGQLLRCFTESELELMYEDNWWRMRQQKYDYQNSPDWFDWAKSE